MSKEAIKEITTQLFAADVARHLAIIANSQHRIACALGSEVGDLVLAAIKKYGYGEQAAKVLEGKILSLEDAAKIQTQIDQLHSWKSELRDALKAIKAKSNG